MAKSTKKPIGHKKTFRELLEWYGTRNPITVEIPQLQRDYAQGRDDRKEVRDNFLDNIFGLLKSGSVSERIYDFVYGRFPEDEDIFIPVDGQQRLTTFFLLHIYIGRRAGEDLSFLFSTTRKGDEECRFSYETRDSSRLFCERLCKIDGARFDDITGYIEDQQWYNDTWKSDPTINGMMTMLQAIGERCEGITDFTPLWENLSEKVKFWVLDLEDLQSSDALYIKMNSRGKKLTDFENFKAEVEGLLSKVAGHIHGSFANDIDTTWTNLFWTYRNADADFAYERSDRQTEIYTDNGLDDRMLSFFRNFMVMAGVRHHIFECSADAAGLNEIELARKVIPSHPELIGQLSHLLRYLYGKVGPGGLTGFFSRFLTLTPEQQRPGLSTEERLDGDYRVNVRKMDHIDCSTVDIFKLFMESPSLSQRVLSYAFFVWIQLGAEKGPVGESEFKDRLRILRNLIANSEIHDDRSSNRKPLRLTMKSVERLVARGVTAIRNRKDDFAEPQKQQELAKSAALAADPTLTPILQQVENHTVIRGNLSQLLPAHPLTLDRFRAIFSEGADYDAIECALLSYGDYSRKERKGERRMYGGKHPIYWRNHLMQNANTDTAPVLRAALSDTARFYAGGLESLRERYVKDCRANGLYPWTYYLAEYPQTRDIPRGVYRVKPGCEYTVSMCNKEGYLMGNEMNWNPFNWTLHTYFEDTTSIGKWNSPLIVGAFSLYSEESCFAVYHNDSLLMRVPVPQDATGTDTQDRIGIGIRIVEMLLDRVAGKPD